MQALICLAIFLMAGCVTFPRDPVIKPAENPTQYCVRVNFERFREGPITREIEAYPLDSKAIAMYRIGLRKFGVETECANPVGSFSIRYTLTNGMKIPSFDLLWYIGSVFTAGIVPYWGEVNVNTTYSISHEGEIKSSAEYEQPIKQWFAIFYWGEEISQREEARKVYDMPNYWDTIIVAKTAEIILKEIATEEKDKI